MKRKIIGLLSLTALFPALAFSAGTVTEYSRELPEGYRHSNVKFGNVPGSVSGPRIAWAEPYALGKLRLLLILPAGASHEANELRSRIPADISLITPTHHEKWFAGGDATLPVNLEILNTSAQRLLSRGCRYDAIVIGKVRWSIIPKEVQDKILEKVRGGTALLWIGPWGVDKELRDQMGLSGLDNPLMQTIRASVPLPILPLDQEGEKIWGHARRVGPPEILTGKLGGGTVVWLDYHDLASSSPDFTVLTPGYYAYTNLALTPFVADDDLHYDYYYSILGKALYHAAGKASGVKVRAQQPILTLEREKTVKAKVAFSLERLDQDLRDLTVIYELRDRQGHVRQKGPVGNLAFDGNTATIAVPLVMLARGTYVVDVWALQRGAVLDWASAVVMVNDTSYLAAVEPAKEYFARDEAIRGTVTFTIPPGKGLVTVVELWDTYGRLLSIAKPAKDDGSFEFPVIAYPFSRTYRLTAKVLEKEFVLDQAEAWFGLPNSVVDDYQFVVWGWMQQRSRKTLLHQFKQHAVTAVYSAAPYGGAHAAQADILARNNLSAYPYTAHVGGLKITPERKFADTLKGYEEVRQRVKSNRRYGAMAYTICEENSISREDDAWNNPEALKDYHAYLNERYSDIAKLNDIWGAKFASFDEIGIITFMDAKATRQPTRWLEQELHKVDRFSQVHEHITRLIQGDDPGARISLDCIEGMDFDWPRMAKIAGAATQCPPLEYLDRESGFLMGTWTGYYACFNQIDEWTMRMVPWKYLFKGGTHMVWWADTFTIDLSEPLLCMQQAVEEYGELENGIGKLLMSSHKRVDPIMVLWSNPSYYAGILNPGEVSWDAAFKCFERMLNRIGFDFQAVGDEFLENSLAYGDTQRVLILPASQAISRKGVEKIKAFADAGGVVIADFLPAVMDEYLRPYGQPAATEKVTFEICAKCQGAKRLEVGNVWQSCPACGGIGQTAKGAAAPSKSLLEDIFDFSQQGGKKIGKGYGLFLKGSPGRREEWGGLRKSLIEKAGLRGDIETQDPLGHLRTDLSSYVFDNGATLFLGVVPDQAMNNPPGENFTVKLGGRLHAYDVRRRQYLGETDTVRTGILPTEAKLLAFLPERIAGLNLSLNKAHGKPGDVLELKGALLPASLKDCRLVVRIEVSRDGKVLEGYTKNLTFQGTFSYPLPLALNQERGQYRVKATEIISGYIQEVTFIVK